MAITASDIHNQSFSIDRKGYDVDEVDVFLEHVADEIDILNDTIAQLQAQLEEDRFSGFDAPAASTVAITETVAASVDTAEYDAQLAQKDAIIADLERQLNDKRADDNAIAQALIIAQRSADEILAKANANATETIQDARDEAQRIIDRANTDRQDVIDAIRKLQDDREDAREEYADLLKDIISDASRKLADIGANVPAAAAAAGDGEYDVAAGLTGNFEIDEYVAPSSYVTPAAPAASATMWRTASAGVSRLNTAAVTAKRSRRMAVISARAATAAAGFIDSSIAHSSSQVRRRPGKEARPPRVGYWSWIVVEVLSRSTAAAK